jgi:hypothetical protein
MGGHVAGDAQHGHQREVRRRVIHVAHLALVVLGPVEGLEGVAQVVGVGRAELQVHVDGAVVAPGVDAEGQRGPGIGQGAEGGEVHLVGHAVAVVVLVPQVGHAVQVGVEALVRRAAQGVRTTGATDGVGPLQVVLQAVAVGVGVEGAGGPVLAVVVEALHLQRVGDQVEVAVYRVREGAQEHLVGVAEAVLIGIQVAVLPGHLLVVGGDPQLIPPSGGQRVELGRLGGARRGRTGGDGQVEAVEQFFQGCGLLGRGGFGG